MYARNVCMYVCCFIGTNNKILIVLLADTVNEMVTDDISSDTQGGATMEPQEAATTSKDLKSVEQLHDTMSTQCH